MRVQTYKIHIVILFWVCLLLALPRQAAAVPDIYEPRISDVTTSSFSMVWMSDSPGNPSVVVYQDEAMTVPVKEGIAIYPMSTQDDRVSQSAANKGLFKVKVTGLRANTRYYAKAVMVDAANPLSRGYSPPMAVNMAVKVVPYNKDNLVSEAFSNDLSLFKVYIRPSENGIQPGLGDIVIINASGASYPVTAYVGDGTYPPNAIVDMNNLFDTDGKTLDLKGGEKLMVSVYRNGVLSVLKHYRLAPVDNNLSVPVELLKGFFADINLDGNVNNDDFGIFKDHYRTLPDDDKYNPDFNFIADPDGVIDAREFSGFSRQYGRTNVK